MTKSKTGAYELDPATRAQINKTFAYVPPHGDQNERYELLRARAKNLARDICRQCPQCGERAHAIARLSEAVMWANASIARNE